jgi:hypothetical protein
MGQKPLVYHTFISEFKGADAKEVIQAVYEDAKQGTGATFQEWWDYQKKLWSKKYGVDIPESPDSPDASQKLLDILVDVGALEVGPKNLRAAVDGTGSSGRIR